jgi:predicted  nucleic acid-binding Zn-ribbon protein
MINEGIFWVGGIMTSIVIAIITAYLNRLIRELDEAKKDIEKLNSRTSIVENQLSNDVINLSKQIELLQGSIRHLENTITANAQAMYTLFMDFKNDSK